MIDVSKAPEGATHYDAHYFYRFDDGVALYYCTELKEWALCYYPGQGEECVPIPEQQADPTPTNQALAAGAEPGTTTAMIDSTLQERGKRYGAFAGHAMISQSLKAVMQESADWQRLAPDQRESLEMIQHIIACLLSGHYDSVDAWHDISNYALLVKARLKADQA